MRLHLDCHDSRLPGTGVFDIKTRVVLLICTDKIRSQNGIMESFERVL